MKFRSRPLLRGRSDKLVRESSLRRPPRSRSSESRALWNFAGHIGRGVGLGEGGGEVETCSGHSCPRSVLNHHSGPLAILFNL